MAQYLNKLEFPSPKDTLSQVLKLVEIGLVVLEKNIKNVKSLQQQKRWTTDKF